MRSLSAMTVKQTNPLGGHSPLWGGGMRWLLALGWLAAHAVSLRGQTPELRGFWVDAFRAGLRNATEARQVIADARAGGFNAVFVQVRKRGDAYYRGGLEPVATDVASGFDPLAELVRTAHDTSGGKARIQVHAWIVAFNIWNRETAVPTQPDHPYRLHPDWLTHNRTGITWDGSNHAFDPGHPEVQEHTHRVAMDIVSRYDVDGIHWDYIRYAGREWGFNAEAVARFNRLRSRTGMPANDDAAWLQFRRDQVTGVVRRLYLDAMRVKPQVIVSAATIAWAPGITATGQFPSSAAYGTVLQDWRGWMEEGLLDLNIPMAYFRQSERAADWSAWSQFAKDHRYRRAVALGMGSYLNSMSNALVQARSTRRPTTRSGPADGMVFYSRGVPATDATTAQFLTAVSKPGAPDGVATPLFGELAPAWEPAWKKSPTRTHLLARAMTITNTPMDGTVVELRRFGAWSQRRTTTTDANGWFGAVDLDPGDWYVRIPAAGSTPAQVSLASGMVGGVATPTFLDEAGDADADGVSNLEEVLAGTDPRAAESVLRVGAVLEPGGVRITCTPRRPGRRYQLEVSEDLGDGRWTVVESNVGPEGIVLAPDRPRAFLHIRLIPE
jgi:uncharacterized lipoprotein YddW (UPF0748 family)